MTVAKRTYRMTARAAAAQATADRIVDAAIEVFWEHPSHEISLEQVARRAGVSKQTLLRRFESKAGLFAAAAERSLAITRSERDDVAQGDVPGAVAALVAHYERVGDRVVRMLAEEERNPRLGQVADQGRAYHAAWCRRTFEPGLARLRGAERTRRLAQLVAVCDVYTWKLLRRDRGLSRPQTETALRELLQPLTGDPT
jgi:AcrR family transcriptional regulator